MLDTANYTPRLKAEYANKIRAALKEEFGYKNEMMIPKLDKIVLNIGCGAEAVRDSKKAKSAVEDLTTIAGQKAVTTKAKKSIAGFRVREDMPMGAKVTLRGDRMYEFIDRLVNVAIPRVRDFRGVPKKFDGGFNYTLGIKDQSIFPEIVMDDVTKVHGMNVTFVIKNANSAEESAALLSKLGMPFVK